MTGADRQRAKRVYWNLRLLGLPEPMRDVWMLVVTVLVVLSLVQISEQTSSTTRTLCVFRADLEHRAAASRQFLLDHPEGFAGIPAATIRVSLMGQERTIRALSGLDCPPSTL